MSALNKEELDLVVEFLTDTLREDGDGNVLVDVGEEPRIIPVNHKLSVVQFTASRLRLTLIELRIRRDA